MDIVPTTCLCGNRDGWPVSMTSDNLVTRIQLESAKTTAGYVISGTMFFEILAELQAVQERLKAKDDDVEILRIQKQQMDDALIAERRAKDLLIQERVAVVLEQENLLLESVLSPEEKAVIEDTIKAVINDKVVPIPIIREPVPIEEPIPIKDEKILEVRK